MNPLTTTAPSNVIPDLWATMLKSGIMLCIVLAVLFGVLYWIKRILDGKSRFHGQEMIKPLASYHLAPKEKLILLDVLGEKLLLGITSQSINCLAKIKNESPIDLPEQPLSKSFFAGLLKTASRNDKTIRQEKKELENTD